MLIADAAARSGLSEDTIRFYEKSGMLPQVARDGRGWRIFTPADVDWLKTLGHLRVTGMPLDDVQAFAKSAHAPDAEAAPERAKRLSILKTHADRLAERRAALDACDAYLCHKIGIYTSLLETT